MEMRAVSNLEILRLWERGIGMHPLDQALLAIAAALPETPSSAFPDWPLGQRNAALVRLIRTWFGASIKGWCECPECDERLEFEMDTGLLTGVDYDDDRPVIVRGRSFRLPTSRDLADIVHETDPRRAAERLLQGCCVKGEESPEWTDEDIEGVGEQLVHADPMAETLLQLRCAICGNEWTEPLDMPHFLWTEIEARAHKLMIEVHALASAYGWSEAEIFGLSDIRRALYLELVQA
jgi:hypothetical protein